MELHVPELALVVLIGSTGSGKSTFAARAFKPTEVVSSDRMRAWVSDDETDQSATPAAFEVLHTLVRKRLERGLLTVVDATNVQPDARRSLIALAKDHHVFAVAIVLDVPDEAAIARNRERPERAGVPPHVVRNHNRLLRRSFRELQGEGFRFVHRLRGVEEVDAAVVVRDRLWVNLRHERGPFDLVGDVHGCHEELVALMEDLGWRTDGVTGEHPEGRKLVFVGDLVDRGPDTPAVLELAMNLVEAGRALVVNGNHDAKLLRALTGAKVKPSHGLDRSLAQLANRPKAFVDRVVKFLDGLLSHYVLDDGRLVVAHAGLPEAMQGRSSGRVREFAMYGETTGEIDDYGLPVRLDWARSYRGRATVVHGHVPVLEAGWNNNTLDIDTGCCFGGKLTALRWPERELVSVDALREHYPPTRPLSPPPRAHAAAIEIDDLLGRRPIETSLGVRVTLSESQGLAALEMVSRFCVDPRWLVHLPPTMSPPATSSRDGLLEHPDEAFGYYADQGVPVVVCEEKHMGSRALFLVCRDAGVARDRFGVDDGSAGIAWTRTGRRLFEDRPTEDAILARLRRAVGAAGLWESLSTGWVLLDAELLPWSAKARALVDQQYAPVGAAAVASTSAEVGALEAAVARGLPLADLLGSARDRRESAVAYDRAWRRYTREVSGPDDLQVAPFHLLASEGHAHFDRDHRWHLEQLGALVGDGVLATAHRFVELADAEARAAAIRWWEERTEAGSEGMVVKPLAYVVRGRRGIVQPAVKCRGPEYLRLIYGPEYRRDANLARLRSRGLATKRQLAVRELALGVEALERFVRRDPLWRVHQAVAAVLALETERVDPRL
jgi:protein phosphatase